MKIKICIFLFLLMLCSCTKVDNQNTTATMSEPNTESIEEHINLELDTNIYVDAYVTIPGKNMLETYSITRETYDEDLLIPLFFSSKDYSYNTTMDGATLMNDGNGYLYYANGDIRYTTKDSYHYAFLNNGFYKRPIEFTRDNMEGDYKDKALERVTYISEQLGLQLEDEPYVVEYFTGKQLEERIRTNTGFDETLLDTLKVKKDWSMGEDCYYILWKYTHNDIPLLNGNIDSSGGVIGAPTIEGSFLFACINREELLYLELTSLYDIAPVPTHSDEVISIQTALDNIKHFYRNIYLKYPIYINNIELCYSPLLVDYDNNTMELVPTWVFYVREPLDAAHKQEKYRFIRFNAYTGDLL